MCPPLSYPQVEARSARNGLGLVKLMGRQSGFIAMQAAMASGGRQCPIQAYVSSFTSLLRHCTGYCYCNEKAAMASGACFL